jgi:hypothetical protein
MVRKFRPNIKAELGGYSAAAILRVDAAAETKNVSTSRQQFRRGELSIYGGSAA